MRVCMLVRNLFVRDARVLREARTLAEAGHEVIVLALRAGDLPEREERDGILILRAVRAGRLAGPTILGAAGHAAPPGRRRAPARPAQAVWLRDLVLARGFTRVARSVKADVYHAHDLNTLEPAWRAARAHGARLVYDAHELYTEMPGLGAGERERWRRVERNLIGEADAIVVPSPARGDVLAERYGTERPVVVMNCPPGSAPPDPAASPIAGLRRGSEPLLVYAGGFTTGRGLENLIHATRMLDVGRTVMIGWGPLEAELRALTERERIGDRIAFYGPIDPDDVVAVVAGADVGLAPYLPVGLNNMLAAPNKLFEYLHAGLAVAASDLPDIRSIVSEHDVGELFDAADPGSIASAVQRLVSPAGRLSDVRARAAAAAGRFTWQAQAKILVATYERLASVRAAGSRLGR
jgi:glycosyltransferase involved in cell wall biosynthesis